MKKIYTVFAALAVFLIIFTNAAFAADIPKPTKNFFVNDFANVISNADEEKMQQQGETLFKKCGAQVVVVTVKSINGEDLESYSLNLARSWGIGSDKNDDGILLLLAVDERKVRIEVGYGLEGALPDSKTGRILDTYGVEHFKKNDFSTGLAAVYDSLINEVYIEKGLDPADGYTPVEDEDYSLTTKEKIITYGIIALIVLAFIFTNRGRRRRGYVYYDGGFGGGGFSGSSSGGGGGFSGGGGSFGGGGSSRGF